MVNKTITDTGVKTWTIDPQHTSIRFRVRHLSVMWVNGAFREFEGSLNQKNDDFEDSEIFFEVQTESIDTWVTQRDNHLRSDDFFGVKEYPRLTFRSASFKKLDDSAYRLTGNLTIRDKTHLIDLDVKFYGSATDEYDREKIGFSIKGQINRKEFGLKWGAVTEAGGVIAGDEVQIICDVQLIS